MEESRNISESREMELVLEHARKHSAMAVLRHNFDAKMRGNYRAFVEDFRTLHDEVILPSILHFAKQRDEAHSLLQKAIQYLIDKQASDISVIAELTMKLKEVQFPTPSDSTRTMTPNKI